jgi:L-lactate dehydrogenase complex protein LldG
MAVTPRDIVLSSIRRSLGVTGAEAPRRMEVATRLAGHPAGVVPQRGQLPPAERVGLFVRMVEAAAGTAEWTPDPAGIPAAVAAFLRSLNLPLAIRHGDDPLLTSVPWKNAGTLEIRRGPSDGRDLAAVSHAFAGIAETGTLVLTSGPGNPTTLNFLPDVHIVAVNAKDVAADFETVTARLRDRYGAGSMPRVVNMITGPSRSADIEQTLILGAHGPRKLHVIVVGEVQGP